MQSTIPNGSFAFTPASPLPGQAITFNGSATSPTGKAIASLEWDFDFDVRSVQRRRGGTPVSHALLECGREAHRPQGH